MRDRGLAFTLCAECEVNQPVAGQRLCEFCRRRHAEHMRDHRRAGSRLEIDDPKPSTFAGGFPKQSERMRRMMLRKSLQAKLQREAAEVKRQAERARRGGK